MNCLFVLAGLMGCPAPQGTTSTQGGPLVVTVDRTTLEANGLDRARIEATLSAGAGAHGGAGVAGLVVSFASTGGLLSSSSMAPDARGVASVTLLVDREEALLGRAEKPVTVRATVTRAVDDIETATVDLVFVAPTSGAPSVAITADPPAALADGVSEIALTIRARRLPAGTVLALSSTAGALAAGSVTLEDDGGGGVHAFAVLVAPTEPATAIVSAREPGGVEATSEIAFVAEGEEQFDLTGTFAQTAPARVRLRAGTLTPNPQCVAAPSFVKVDIVQSQDGDGNAVIDAVYSTCFVTLAPVTSIVGEVTNTAGPAFVAAIPQVRATFTLDDVVLGTAWAPPPSVVVSGAALESATEALPTDADDARVRDSDADGAPGVTVVSSLGGEQNITFRNTGETRGVVVSSNRIVGESIGDMTALPESSVLGAGNAFLPAFESVPSVFEMVRVDGRGGAADMDTNGDGEVTCTEIVDAADFLFTLVAPATPLDCAGVP